MNSEATTSNAAPAYRPSEHGMVTADFVADFLDALSDGEASDDDPDEPTATPTKPAGPKYVALLATEGHFASSWFPGTADPALLALRVAEQLDGHPLGPTRVKSTIDYLYYAGRLAECEAVCCAWIRHAGGFADGSPKTKKKGKGQRVTAYRDVAETGLRCAYRLRDEGMAARHYPLLTPFDGNLSYVLGTYHLHFPSLNTPTAPHPATLAAHLWATHAFRPSDPATWDALALLLANSRCFGVSPVLATLAHLVAARAVSMLDNAKLAASPTARATWDRRRAPLAARLAGLPPAVKVPTVFRVGGRRVHAVPSPKLVAGDTEIDAMVAEVSAWEWTAADAGLGEEEWDTKLLAAVYDECARGIARAVNPAFWACGRAGILDVAVGVQASVVEEEEEEETGVKNL
ncbi:hypothetical protein H9P43_009300 [Blastocladiella emersonii ATCC 22665]|nr:hypothetical protein H9P43_009300 [Blastocladiella emersonii ATCC 22665]